MTPDIIEGNEKIARWMGYVVERSSTTFVSIQPITSKIEWNFQDDWRLLIPVIQKIDALWMQYNLKDWRTDTDQYKYLDVISLPIGTPIMEVWEKVVKFIDWYNEQNVKG
jgi:hypothetical protein